MLRDLLAQPVVTIVVIPVGLAVVSLIFEWGVRRTKGKPISVTKNMRIWVQESELDDNGNETFIYRPLVDDLDTLASLHLDYSTRQDLLHGFPLSPALQLLFSLRRRLSIHIEPLVLLESSWPAPKSKWTYCALP
jgi:hypothetical protein